MKKNYYLFFFLVFLFSGIIKAQTPLTYEVPSEQFPDLASVADYINSNNTTEGGTRFLIAGNSVFNENSIIIAGSGTDSAPFGIHWDGQGDKPVLNFPGTTGDGEAGITLLGASYITLDGLDIRNPDGMLEYGILITNSSPTRGSWHNTVKNTRISLDKTNANITNGIRVFAGETPIQHSGSNSNNHFYNNHISNVVIGYNLNSLTGEVDLMDSGNITGILDGGKHIIEDIVMCGVYWQNQNGGIINGLIIRDLNRPVDGTNTAPAAISTTGDLPSGPLTYPLVISNNVIRNLYTDATTIFGMYLNQRNVHNEIYANTLDNIRTDAGTNTYANGIILFATDCSANIYNNMVSAIASPLSTSNVSSGIYVRLFSFANIFYNSVMLEYDAADARNRSAALYIHNGANPVDLRNNIFVNKSTVPEPGTGFVTAFFKNTVSLANISGNSDKNIYFAGEPSGMNLIYVGGSTRDETLEDYKLRADIFDQQSFTENVPFLSVNNLHIDPTVTTHVRDNAQPISAPIAIETDINGKQRHLQTPDIGAQELPLAYPLPAVNPTPSHEQTGVKTQGLQLKWQHIPGFDFASPQGFHVYFGKDNPPTEENYQGWISRNEDSIDYVFDVSDNGLDNHTTYFWKVIPATRENEGNVPQESAVWTFTTEDNSWVNETNAPVIQIYPNPASSHVNIILDDDYILQLIAIDGTLHRHVRHRGPMVLHDLSGLTPGLYILKVSTNSHTHSQIIQIIH